MGIKGIYGEIGPGERISLSKLAIQKYEETERPLRLAIDVSIWQFQIQAGRGGSDPATRTLYYRLQRLLASSIHPLFVFDGPHRPPIKRNKRTGGGGGSVSNLLTKKLLTLFGFPYHQAPGEAEAECALLQREGIVDAVLSEDVDTLMFGSGLTLRNWSSEGRGNKSPTHVNAYHAKATKDGRSGLDREGMILVALMSGGDYNTEGITGCGIKIACEAARAGYGKLLCQVSRNDVAGYKAWRNELAHEILTNESKQFKTKRKSLIIPADFPDLEILSYYTHPVVSKMEKINKLKTDIQWDGEVDIAGLRQFTADAFEWTHKGGCKKFIRGIAPALLVQKLRLRANRRESGYGDLVLIAMNETEIIRSICGNRKHFSMDGMPELRLAYVPIDIIGLNLDDEEDPPEDDYGRDGLAPRNEEDEFEEYVSDDASRSVSPTKRGPSTYDPTQPDKVWIPHTIAKVGIPLKVEDYEESLRAPKKVTKAKGKAAPKKFAAKGGIEKEAMKRFVKVSKSAAEDIYKAPTKETPSSSLPPVFLAPSIEKLPSSSRRLSSERFSSQRARTSTDSLPSKPTSRPSKSKNKIPKPNTNPWTIAAGSPSSQPTTRSHITKPSSSQTAKTSSQIYILSSSPPVARARSPTPTLTHSSPPNLPARKHVHCLSSSSQESNPEHDLPPTVQLTRGSKAKGHTTVDSFATPTNSNKPPRKKISPEQYVPVGSGSRSDVSPVRKAQVIVLGSSPASPPSSQSLSQPLSQTLDSQSNGTQVKASEKVEVVEKKKVFMLRESLPGAWKTIDADEAEMEDKRLRMSKKIVGNGRREQGTRWRESQVEILDLTED